MVSGSMLLVILVVSIVIMVFMISKFRMDNFFSLAISSFIVVLIDKKFQSLTIKSAKKAVIVWQYGIIFKKIVY